VTLAVRLLGPLEVECDGGRVVFGAPMERALVALLALSVGRVVSTDRVIDELWLEPPPSARRSIRVLVSRVRRALGESGAGATLLTRSPGYMFDGAAVVVDAVQFETLAASGHALLAEGRVDDAAETLANSLALWRGDGLAECTGTHLRAEAARLDELRLAALEDRVDADLERGRHADLIAEVTALCRSNPLRERLWGQLVVALYRCGRQAEALRAYDAVRTVLRDELGIDPSPDLRLLERAVLSQDPQLASHFGSPRGGPRSQPTTRSVLRVARPRSSFVGRASALDGVGVAHGAPPRHPDRCWWVRKDEIGIGGRVALPSDVLERSGPCRPREGHGLATGARCRRDGCRYARRRRSGARTRGRCAIPHRSTPACRPRQL